jgi:DNA-binding transcriptional regulator YiaG
MGNRVRVTDDIVGDLENGTFQSANGALIPEQVGAAALVRVLIESSGISSTAWADTVDVDPRIVRRWKSGEESPNPAMRKRLLRILAGNRTRAAENPLILTVLVAAMLPTENKSAFEDAAHFSRITSRARVWANEIEKAVEAERNVRIHTDTPL